MIKDIKGDSLEQKKLNKKVLISHKFVSCEITKEMHLIGFWDNILALLLYMLSQSSAH